MTRGRALATLVVLAILSLPAWVQARTPETGPGGAPGTTLDVTPNDGDGLADSANLNVSGVGFTASRPISLLQCTVSQSACSFDLANNLQSNSVGGFGPTPITVTRTFVSDEGPTVDCGVVSCAVWAGDNFGKSAQHHISFASAPPVDTTPPQTSITTTAIKQAERRATFRFISNEAGSSFRCKLDDSPYGSCTSPKTYRDLSVGRHKFRVRARDAAGNLDPSPAEREFRISPP